MYRYSRCMGLLCIVRAGFFFGTDVRYGHAADWLSLPESDPQADLTELLSRSPRRRHIAEEVLKSHHAM